ncbi:MAG: lysine--tRNA ligase [Candidatus Tectimicrobiota bacterium]|nr:MAG: lysine--tRNA ligase [Candidatus Tectomicrobia bacterium]
MTSAAARHWADEIADAVLQRQAHHVISTGITPSGEFHVGHLREVLTAEAVYRALKERGVSCRFHYVADSMDPLRHVYPFLDPARYREAVGKPLCDIPCPCDGHPSYAEHYLEPFLQAVQKLGITLEVLRADALYRQGKLDAQILTALQHTQTIKRILHEETGREVAEDWSPFTPLCAACGRLTTTRVTGFDVAAKTVSYACRCGHRDTAPVSQAGKLTWRVDWPARWQALGVTIEPFGKDHASRGGSYDTGQRIVREVFGGEPPYPIPYEWIALAGQGDMSSSKGNLISIFNLTQTVPPEVVRYMIFRVRPMRHLVFDPGLPLLNLVDEYDNLQGSQRNARAAELARLDGTPPLGFPFKHLVTLVQLTGGDADKITAILKRQRLPVPPRQVLESRIAYARHWLAHFCPPQLRVELQDTLPPAVAQLSPSQRQALGELAQRLQPEMDGDAIHALVYTLAQACGLPAKELFAAIYLAFLGQPQGPRAGWFLSSLDFDFVRRRLQEAAQGQGEAA